MISKSTAQRGFSLLEILVAFSILAMSLGILLNIFSGGLRRAIISEEYQQAVTIAQSKLAAVGLEQELEVGSINGNVDDKFFWQVNINEYNFEEVGLDVDDIAVSPYQVNVIVEWFAGENNRQIVLTTLKLSGKENGF